MARGRKSGCGHRTVPHTADVRIEAWAPTREECLAEAVRAMVDSFADIRGVDPTATREVHLPAGEAADELTALLDEVVYRMDVAGEIPLRVRVSRHGTDLLARFAMADTTTAPQTGAVPKAVSLHELRFDRGSGGWTCAVTLDV